jgi:UDP-3-O-[3-hydroxymyristoyl] glucosamine N-acyltransferase
MMFTVQEVLRWSEAQVANSEEESVSALLPSLRLKRLATLKDAGPEDVAFFFSKNYEADLRSTRAGVIVTGSAFVGLLKAAGLAQWKQSIFLACADPYSAMAKVTREVSKQISAHDHQEPPIVREVHPTAIIDATAEIGLCVKIGPQVVIEAGAVIEDGVTLYPGVYIGPKVRVGSGTVIFPRVTVYEKTEIGRRCRIHAGVVIGTDGFGYAPKADPVSKLTIDHQKIYHLGRVIIEDEVEIGANSTIDRGTLGDTIIRTKVKIDNQVQIGHNVELQEGAILCGCSGVAGSSTVGKFSIVGAQAGLGNQVQIGDYCVLAAYTGVTKDFPSHSILAGRPSRLHAEQYKIMAIQQKLLKERGKKK